jgi:WD40 repeat protein
MTDFSSYFLTIFSTKKNLQYYQKSQIFNFEQTNKSVSFKNKNLLISRSALTGFLIQKLIRNPGCIQLPASKQKQFQQIMSRWNKLEIPRPLPIKINIGNYTAIANHCNKQFVATGDYDGSVKIWRFQNYQYESSEKILLKSRFLTVKNVVFHKSLSLIFANDSKGNSKLWKIGANTRETREFWSPSREITQIFAIEMHPTMPIVVIADENNTTVYILNEYGKEIGYVFLQDRIVSCMSFSKSGKHLAIGNLQGQIKIFFFEQDEDGSLIIYQTDSFEYTSKITNIVMTDKIVIFGAEDDEILHVFGIDENSKLSKSQILKVMYRRGYLIDIMLSDCEKFFYVRTYSEDSEDSDDSDDSDDSYDSDDFCNQKWKIQIFYSNFLEDVSEPSKISIFILNNLNQVIPVGETITTSTFLSFGRNGELICA